MPALPRTHNGPQSAASAADKPVAERLEPSRLADVVECSEPLTTPAPQVVVSRRAPSNTISTRQDMGTLLRPSLWSRVWRSARRVVASLILRPAPHESGDMWNKVGSVAIILDGQEISPVAAVILLDPGCENVNLISTGMMRRAGRNYDTASGVHIGSFLDGQECWSLGEVYIRWYTKDYRMKFEDATCHVVDTVSFDLLIGKADIDRLQLFKPNRRPIGRIGAFFATRPKVKAESISQQDDAVEALRIKEKERKAQREKELAQEKATTSSKKSSNASSNP